MTEESIKSIHNSLLKLDHWLNEIMERLHWQEKQKAYIALKTVLHALRDRLPTELNAHLSAQLPLVIRGLYFEGWNPSITPVLARSVEEFLDMVSQETSNAYLQSEAETITRHVFQVIQHHLSPGLIEKIKHAMPKSIQTLW